MPELFTDLEQKPLKKKRDGYHAGNGKYTDQITSLIDQTKKECQIHKNNETYYKRQCERLQQEVLEEKEKRKELEKQLS